MAKLSLVRQDGQSIYVVAGGYTAQPGEVNGYAHAYDMSDGDLKAGDRVKARHLAGTPITRITTASGRVLHWHHRNSGRFGVGF